MTDWTDLTAADFMKIAYMHTAYADLVDLGETMLAMLQRTVRLQPVAPEEDERTIPFPALINIIERNIDVLTAGGYYPSNLLPTRQWAGETADEPRFCYADVNRWFDSFKKIDRMVQGIYSRLLVTGTFCSGGDRTRQLIRTV